MDLEIRVLALSAIAGCGGVAAEDELTPATIESRHPSAGVILYDGSAIDPWCGAVLVRPDAVLTAAHCVEKRAAPSLQFTFDDHRSPSDRAIRSITVHPEYRESEELRVNLALLVLEQPIEDREPAALGSDASGELSLMSALFAVRGKTYEMRAIEGELVEGPEGMISVRFPLAEVACHGENGTGLYAGDRLIGIGSGGFFLEPNNELGCYDVLTFAPVADQLETML